ncbi:MAG: hypothetical protein D6752_04425 [Candidatus Nitrosothermus koennekii]|jgi:hypothetical protein|nr:MAG: hypothetical protein D6752_04425 [Candidatus Nitrosothermus koennekii]
MAKKVGELFATDYMKLEFERDDRLGEDAIMIRSLWWNAQHGEWEILGEVLIPTAKMDDVIKILNKAKE